ncbi:Acetyltransferase, GNAT family [Desulfonatronum thiosulfatophilum]|uniref:Acetyltransferase, GNAT family n=1 Tax=Desulfonatronum thiosulfatophilum TaxID=617002 RepID=A0A1G6DDP3_9BACT|nr:GNAT family N-acetyltransferase [Desulfonatronum thiosulfatophilum]SDB43248.1 Acetyltransferase, GNAT family [Desulfonatronum thiosulfatophilum]
MTSPVTIRTAIPGDIPEMVALLGELFAIEADFRPDPALQHQGLALMLRDPVSRRILVAVEDGKVIGMCSLQILVSTAQGGQVGLVEDVVVAAPWRGRGIGAMLMRALEESAAEIGLSRLQLLADADNVPALNFYRLRGWNSTKLICLRKEGDPS